MASAFLTDKAAVKSSGDSLMSEDQLIEFFKDSFKFDETEILKKDKIIQEIRSVIRSNDQSNLDSFMHWASSISNLKVTSAMMKREIAGIDCTLHDVKVQSRGPDDAVYDRDAQIRAKIARGTCVMEYHENGKRQYDLITFALRKFTGGLGDEDDVDRDQNTWVRYFLADISVAKYVFSLHKANGEAAHLSCRYINGKFIICGGSKNVHLLFKNSNDILYCYNEPRYQVAKEVSITICRYLESLDEKLRNTLLSFLSLTKLTVVFEILQPEHQHVEDLSYLDRPLLKFITFTKSEMVDKPKTLCFPPNYSVEIGKLFGFSCVTFNEVKVSEVENYIKKVREDYGHEGVVLYFMDENLNTIGILKKKTVWYIIVRALREKLRSFLSTRNPLTSAQLEEQIVNRLRKIKTWIGFSEEYHQNWKKLSLEFAKWFAHNIKVRAFDRETFDSKYPTLWTKFLEENKLTDKFEMDAEFKDEHDKILHQHDDKPTGLVDGDEEEEAKNSDVESKKASSSRASASASNKGDRLSKKEKRKMKKEKESEKEKESDIVDDFDLLGLNDSP